MKKRITIISSIVFLLAAVNFTAAFFINRSDSPAASSVNATFGPAVPYGINAEDETPSDGSSDGTPQDDTGSEDVLHKGELQLNRYNISRFIKELRYGTDLNSYTLSQHLDRLGIPYACIDITTPDDTWADVKQMLAMSAVYTGYNVDNITHFENYARCLWAATHYITVGDSRYPADILIDNTASLQDFYKSVSDEYSKNGIVELKMTPADGNYYELDPAENFTWDDEKIAEAEDIRSMTYMNIINYLLKRNDETVLYSPLPLYNQGSGTWCNVQFGGGTVRSDGCCPCSISMVVSYFKNERITPDVVATLYNTDEFRSITSGSYGTNMCRMAAADFGLNVTTEGAVISADQIVSYLSQGYKMVISVKGYDPATQSGGDYSTGFHYIALAGLTSDGYVIVNNPGFTTDITYDTPEKVAGNQSGKCYAVFSSAD